MGRKAMLDEQKNCLLSDGLKEVWLTWLNSPNLSQRLNRNGLG
jgi:hypothetical protein